MVTGVTSFGLFVQLHGLMIDGLVHVSSLSSDYYHFDQASMSLSGERSGKRYGLGDELEVIVSRVDLETRRIDFQLADQERRGGKRQGKKRR